MSVVAALSVALSWATVLAPQASAAPDTFFSYSGETPLSSIAPGTVLASRSLSYHVSGSATEVTAVQLLYRTTDSLNRPTINVTSVLKPAGGTDGGKAIAYQSYYDSLSPEHGPSRVIAGGVSFGGMIVDSEETMIRRFLGEGYTVIVADTEGQTANFAAGPEYG
ncbi:hypothetical protein ACFU44_05715 [Nocardia rhizosphaerihabitans]|uniref:hypothetical protein n=1 Tax=Nocardia rhizosphaerihabitans TaxID=1691570 RepID=UPI00366C8F7B